MIPTEEQLREAGFAPEVKSPTHEPFETGFWRNKSWVPVPRVDMRIEPSTGHIGGMQFAFKKEEQWQSFVEKAIPKFCDPK